MNIYNWLICKISKRFHLGKPVPTAQKFKAYCDNNPWERSCRVYED